MAAIGKLRTIDGGRVAFMCPGCKEMHQVRVTGDLHPRWDWNGSHAAPTFTPSILVWWDEPSDVEGEFDEVSKDRRMTCHSFVTDGRIQFLGDCTHALAGQTVDLPDMAE